MTEVCVEALRNDLSRHAEHIIIRRLGDDAAPVLISLLDDADSEIQRRVRSTLAAIGAPEVLKELEDLHTNTPVSLAMWRHLSAGRIVWSKLSVLHKLLRATDSSSNWERVAVFGYYAANDCNLSEIDD